MSQPHSSVSDSSVVERTEQRQPLQARSRASLERMLQAARTLMIERGNDDFTLNDVSRHGQVSIGSIYHRFESRDELIRAVQAVFLAELDVRQDVLVTRVAAEATGLRMLVTALIDQLAEIYREASPLMRPIMLRASTDPVVATAGKQGYERLATRVVVELLRYREEIARPDPARAALASFDIIYAALARYLGFGTADIAAGRGDWAHLKADLGQMWAAFLLHP